MQNIPTPIITKGALRLATAAAADSESDEEENDDIRLWEPGWKERYYQAKFGVSLKNFEFRRKVACAYVEGLFWVLRYYYQVLLIASRIFLISISNRNYFRGVPVGNGIFLSIMRHLLQTSN